MQIIQKIYQTLLDLFNFKKRNIQNIKDKYIGSLSFYITSNKDIDIVCSMPDLSDTSLDDLNVLAETYAEFLLYINDGYLKDDILQILSNKYKNNNLTDQQQAKHKLFVDNVIFHWAIIYTENLKKKKQNKKDDLPLIRPSSVFHQL